MKWIYTFLNFVIIFVFIHAKPYSIHVSIHYPKGNKRPEIYVSEDEKSETAKDVKIAKEPGISTERSPPVHNPETADLFSDDPVDGAAVSSVPQIVVPIHTEHYHMTKSEKRHHNQVVNPQEGSPVGFKGSRQDDPRTRGTQENKHLKETYWNYKNPPMIRKPARESSQNHRVRGVKAYERVGQEALFQPEGIEYRDGAVAKAGIPPHKSARKILDYEEINKRIGPAEQLTVEKKRADDYESHHIFTKAVKNHKPFDPYQEINTIIKEGYRDYSVVKGCVQVGHMMPNPNDRCGYLECVHAEELHYLYDLVAQPRKCAPGAAVPYSWRGGLDNPCTEAAAYCKNVHEVEDMEEEPRPRSDIKLHDKPAATKEEINANKL